MSIYVMAKGPCKVGTHSALKPLTCRIFICFTMVLFPDSPAPSKTHHKYMRTSTICTQAGSSDYETSVFGKKRRQFPPSLLKGSGAPINIHPRDILLQALSNRATCSVNGKGLRLAYIFQTSITSKSSLTQ